VEVEGDIEDSGRMEVSASYATEACALSIWDFESAGGGLQPSHTVSSAVVNRTFAACACIVIVLFASCIRSTT
jgi:hypothetical protein